MFKSLFIIITILCCFKVYASDDSLPAAVVQKVLGTVLFEGKTVNLGDTINKPGLLETKEKSIIILKIEKWGNSITLGPLSQMKLNFNEEKKYTLDKGICRWKTAVDAAKEAIGVKGKIYTRYVSLGVRGTDFFLKTNTLLGESEIIMFDGEVQMDNLNDPENSVIVKKGQWGGVGGRYGKKIAPPIDLPQSVLEMTSKVIEAQ